MPGVPAEARELLRAQGQCKLHSNSLRNIKQNKGQAREREEGERVGWLEGEQGTLWALSSVLWCEAGSVLNYSEYEQALRPRPDRPQSREVGTVVLETEPSLPLWKASLQRRSKKSLVGAGLS